MIIRQTPQIIYWHTVLIRKSLDNEYDNRDGNTILNEYGDELYRLLSGALKSLDWEKVGFGFESIRANRASRLVIRTVPDNLIEGKRCTILARAMRDHDAAYERLNFLKDSVENELSHDDFNKDDYIEVTLDSLMPKIAPETQEEMQRLSINILYGADPLVLDEDQEKVLAAFPPLLINGIGGAGKTVSQFTWLTQSVLNPSNAGKNLNYLYAAENPELRKKFLNLIADTPLANIRDMNVYAMDFLTLIRNLDSTLARKKDVDKTHFIDWFTAYVNKNKKSWAMNNNNLGPKKDTTWDKFIANLNPEIIYQELRLMSGFPEQEYVVELGTKKIKSQVPPEKRKFVANIHRAYQKQLNAEGAFHPAFYRLPPDLIPLLPDFELVMPDEGQDYSTAQWLIYMILSKGKLIGCMDTHQALKDPISQRFYLTTRPEFPITLCELPYNHRCAEFIAYYAMEMMNIKKGLTGGTADKYEAKTIKVATDLPKGSVVWSPLKWNKEKGQIVINEVEATQGYVVSPDTIVITTEEFKAEAERFYTKGRVVLVTDIKGLEYDEVILYRLTESEIFKLASKLLQQENVTLLDLEKTANCPKGDVGNNDFRVAFNHIITACTRARRRLVIMEREDDHNRMYLLNLFKEAVPDQDIIENTNTASQAKSKRWLKELKKKYTANEHGKKDADDLLLELMKKSEPEINQEDIVLYEVFKKEELEKEQRLAEQTIILPFPVSQTNEMQSEKPIASTVTKLTKTKTAAVPQENKRNKKTPNPPQKVTASKNIKTNPPQKSTIQPNKPVINDKAYLESLFVKPSIEQIQQLLEKQNIIDLVFSTQIDVANAIIKSTGTLIEYIKGKSHAGFSDLFFKALMGKNKKNVYYIFNLIDKINTADQLPDKAGIIQVILTKISLENLIQLYDEAIIKNQTAMQKILDNHINFYVDNSFVIIKMAVTLGCAAVFAKISKSESLSLNQEKELMSLGKSAEIKSELNKYFTLKLNDKVKHLTSRLLKLNKNDLIELLKDDYAAYLLFEMDMNIPVKNKMGKFIQNPAKKGKLINYLLSNVQLSTLLNDVQIEANQSIFCLAIDLDNLEVVKKLLKESDEVIPMIQDNYNILFHAIRYEKIEIVDYLLTSGFPYQHFFDGGNVLHYAVLCTDNVKLLSLLLNHVNKALNNANKIKEFIDAYTTRFSENSENKLSALHIAVIDNKYNLVKCLLDYQANPNIESTQTYTSPLQIAVSNENEKMTTLLLGRGATITNMRGLETPLHSALKKNNDVIINLLLGQSKQIISIIFQAISHGDLSFLQKIATKCKYHNEFAVDCDFLSIPDKFKTLINDILIAHENDSKVLSQWTALHYAIFFGHLDIVNFYLENKPSDDVMSRSRINIEALITCLVKSKPEIYQGIYDLIILGKKNEASEPQQIIGNSEGNRQQPTLDNPNTLFGNNSNTTTTLTTNQAEKTEANSPINLTQSQI